ncbi:barstar family protein [Streptomyces sp. NPDC051994]|uniref:barstar family protein n=1 Tax=unclassified Streptomyces TaxID=2593676 RepID=UPI00342CC053
MTADPYDGLLAGARAEGWATQVLDLAGVTGKAALMDRFARALHLPDWFGRNWDALADSLGDLPARPGADRGLLLLVTGWQGYAETRPEEWALAREVMDAATGPELCVLLALGGSH